VSEDDEGNRIAPLVYPMCRHIFMVPVQATKNVCPFCGNCYTCE